MVKKIRDVNKELEGNLAKALVMSKNYADRHRMIAPDFQVGDLVWLNRKNIKTIRPCRKFDFKLLGPFKISEKVTDVNFRLDLPQSMKVHNVFHVSLLEPYRKNVIDNRVPPIVTPVESDSLDVFDVEDIIDSRFVSGKLQYLVHWKGYGPADRTWEPKENVSSDLKRAFHQKYPLKPAAGYRRGRK